jgi:hypothetical protein
MTLMTAFRDARDRVSSLALSLGYFDAVAQHEPKNAPGKGLSLFVFAEQFQPVQSSALDATSVRLNLIAQLRCSALREPQDDIDLDLIEAADALCAEISADFDLGTSVRNVDLLGQHGETLGGRFGYVDHDNRKFRIVDIMIPCIINDVWTQGA